MIKLYILPVVNPVSKKYSAVMCMRGQVIPLTFDVFREKQEAYQYCENISKHIDICPVPSIPHEGVLHELPNSPKGDWKRLQKPHVIK